jgi:glycosyltransferase involved in cell wall biosynthesis
MLRVFFLLLFVTFQVHSSVESNSENLEQTRPLKIYIFTRINGAGLEADQYILRSALKAMGHQVSYFQRDVPLDAENVPIADLCIHIEIVNPDKFSFGRVHWMIPNPEWYMENQETEERFQLFLCRTREVERIFKQKGRNTYFIGFTSLDHFRKDIPKDYHRLIHFNGTNDCKGTREIYQAWRQNPNLPQLDRIGEKYYPELSNLHTLAVRLPTEEFLYAQNNAGIHIYPSYTEGFGHNIVEAMATKAVVITTDAPPMNEFITDPRCLVAYSHTERNWASTMYIPDPKDLEKKIFEIGQLSEEELREIGEKNRENYLKMKQEFHQNLESLIKYTASYLAR